MEQLSLDGAAEWVARVPDDEDTSAGAMRCLLRSTPAALPRSTSVLLSCSETSRTRGTATRRWCSGTGTASRARRCVLGPRVARSMSCTTWSASIPSRARGGASRTSFTCSSRPSGRRRSARRTSGSSWSTSRTSETRTPRFGSTSTRRAAMAASSLASAACASSTGRRTSRTTSPCNDGDATKAGAKLSTSQRCDRRTWASTSPCSARFSRERRVYCSSLTSCPRPP